MTAVGRALMAKPKMILLDEPSMGLAPQIVSEIFEIVEDLNKKENVSKNGGRIQIVFIYEFINVLVFLLWLQP